jgi:hypothetical protein
MFGLFDPPNVVIRKRLPRSAHLMFDLIESAAATELSHVKLTRQSYMLGAIMSVWACNNCTAGHIMLSDFNFRYVQNLGTSCFTRLSESEQHMVAEILDSLKEKSIL